MHKNRTAKWPLMTEKELKKQSRHSFDYKVDRDHSIMVCEWYNKLVIMGSNVHGVHPLVKVKWFERKNKNMLRSNGLP